uniref:Uncharacterized protein n=1 Tax=Arundo donax TaxID=35708 RepID=A0A0A9FXC1_ARUDO
MRQEHQLIICSALELFGMMNLFLYQFILLHFNLIIDQMGAIQHVPQGKEARQWAPIN